MSTVAAVVVQEEGHSPIYVFYIDGKPVGSAVGEPSGVEWTDGGRWRWEELTCLISFEDGGNSGLVLAHFVGGERVAKSKKVGGRWVDGCGVGWRDGWMDGGEEEEEGGGNK